MSQPVQHPGECPTRHPTRAARSEARKPSLLAHALSGTALAVMLASSAPAHAQLSAETQRHLTASVKNAGGDVEVYNNWRTYACSEVEDPNVFDRWSAERRREIAEQRLQRQIQHEQEIRAAAAERARQVDIEERTRRIENDDDDDGPMVMRRGAPFRLDRTARGGQGRTRAGRPTLASAGRRPQRA